MHVREAGSGPAVLLLHGYPESSYMWRAQIAALAAAGFHALAPDLPGYGDSPPESPGTWEHHMEALERFHEERDLGPVALVLHDWGCLIGLRWACEHPQKIAALVVSSGGFFPDGRWHELARTMRTPGEGEQLMEALQPDAVGALLRSACSSLDDAALAEYLKCFADPQRRQAQLELYRSGDFEKLAAYDLGILDVPALVIWGEDDAFAPPAGARRFQRELRDCELVLIEGAGHFVWEDEPARTSDALTEFLRRRL
ncbi:MAG: alpha/beta fold hydrolase [Solirubrobacteraceae bacterium]